MGRGKSESLQQVASSLATHLRSGGDIREFHFEPRKVVLRSWPPDSFDFRRQNNENSVFIGFPYFPSSVNKGEIHNSIFVDCDLSGLGRPRSRLDSVLVLGTGTASVCAPAVSSEPIKVRVHNPKPLQPKRVQVKLEDLRSDLKAVGSLNVFQPLKLGQTSTCRARGMDLSHCEVLGEAVFNGVDLTAAIFYHAVIKGHLVLQDCRTDGIDLRSIEIAPDARLSLVASDADVMLSIERLCLGTSTSEAQGQVLLRNVRLADSQIGEDSIDSSPSWVSLAEGTSAEFAKSRLSNAIVDLTDLKEGDELILSECELNHLTLKGLGTAIRLRDCRGELLLKGCKGASLFISGESGGLSIRFEDCQSISIISAGAASLALSLVRTTLGKKVQVVGSRLLEFTKFDATSSISIDDAESSFAGSKVKKLQFSNPGQLVFRSEARLDLAQAVLEECHFRQLSLSQCRLDGTTFRNCDLTDSTIASSKGCTFQDCTLAGCTMTDSSQITISGPRTILSGLKLPDHKLQGYVLDGLLPEQISELNLDDKHLLDWRISAATIPDLEMSETILENVELHAAKMNGWRLSARKGFRVLNGEDIVGKGMVHLRGSTRQTSHCAGKAVFTGCQFEATDFWRQGTWDSLEFEGCVFRKDVVGDGFPWQSVEKVCNTVLEDGLVKTTSLLGDFNNTQFRRFTLDNASFSGDERSVDLRISDSKRVNQLSFSKLSCLSLEITQAPGQQNCTSLRIESIKRLRKVLLEDACIDGFSIDSASDSGIVEGYGPAHIIMRGSSVPLSAKNIELRSLNGAILELNKVSIDGFKLISSTLSQESSVKEVSIRNSHIEESNILDLAEGQLKCMSFNEKCKFKSIAFTKNFSSNAKGRASLAGCSFSDCDFTRLGSSLKGSSSNAVDLHSCSFDAGCDFSGMEVEKVDFSGCTELSQKMDRTVFRDCMFKGANFTLHEDRVFCGVSFQNCEFDEYSISSGKAPQFSRCEFHGPKWPLFSPLDIAQLARAKVEVIRSLNASPEAELSKVAKEERLSIDEVRALHEEMRKTSLQEPDLGSVEGTDINAIIASLGSMPGRSPWYPRFRDVQFHGCLLYGISFAGSSGNIELVRSKTKQCAFGDGPISIKISGGSLETTSIESTSLKTLEASLTSVRDLTLDAKSGTGRFTFIQCPDVVLNFIDRRFSGKLEMELCEISRLLVARPPIQNSAAGQTCVGTYFLNKCRLRPSKPGIAESAIDSIIFQGFAPHTDAIQGQAPVRGRLFGKDVSSVIRRISEVLGDSCVDLDDLPDSDWTEIVRSQGLAGEAIARSRQTLQDIAERKLLGLARHFEPIWQNITRDPSETVHDLESLKYRIASASLPPCILVAQREAIAPPEKEFNDIRDKLYKRIGERERIAEGGFEKDLLLRETVMKPTHYIELISDLLSKIALSVGRYIPGEDRVEAKHLLTFLNGELFAYLGEPLPKELPIIADTARIYLDTACFSRLLQTKILENLEIHVDESKCWLSFSEVEEDGIDLLCLSISDKGIGFNQEPTSILEGRLNTDKFEEIIAFASRFCSSLSVITICDDGARRSFTVRSGELEFSLDDESPFDGEGFGTTYLFRYPICKAT
jgi:uncharacterized protein YjbI with pentapeptide repeats